MRSAGLSKQKTSYLQDMSERARQGDLDFSRLHEFTDEEVIAHLTQVKGVGVWTAHMFLMFTLKRRNVLPTGDFGIRMAMKKALPETQDAHAGTDGKDSQGLGTAPQCRLLVSLEKPGSKTVSLGNFRVSLLPPCV